MKIVIKIQIMTTGYKITELFRTVRLKWAEPTVTGAKRKGKAQKLLVVCKV